MKTSTAVLTECTLLYCIKCNCDCFTVIAAAPEGEITMTGDMTEGTMIGIITAGHIGELVLTSTSKKRKKAFKSSCNIAF